MAHTGKKKKVVLKKKPKTTVRECKYELELEASEPKMLIRCIECPGYHSLENDECLLRVLQAVANELKVESVILSHYTDVEYFGPATELLKQMVQFMSQLDNFAIRDPVREYFDYLPEKDKKKLGCKTCAFNPQRIFSDLKSSFINDLGKYYQDYYHTLNRIGLTPQSQAECTECTLSTIEDLAYLFELFDNLIKYIRRVGGGLTTDYLRREIIAERYTTPPVYPRDQSYAEKTVDKDVYTDRIGMILRKDALKRKQEM